MTEPQKRAFEHRKTKIMAYLLSKCGQYVGPTEIGREAFQISASNILMSALKSLVAEGKAERMSTGKYAGLYRAVM
jgi:hypothetical protein